MTEAQYRIFKADRLLGAEQHLPLKDLLVVPYGKEDLKVGVFGLKNYQGNLHEMRKHYFHSKEHSDITFRPLTTPQSIFALAWNFQNEGKSKILDPKWLQLGWALKTERGVYTNLPNDAQGNPITDLDALKRLLVKAKKIKVGNGDIYLGEKDFGFLPYDFPVRLQSVEYFVRGGLARLLEGTPEIAVKLSDIASKKNYPRGINVSGFEPTEEPTLMVVGLCSGRDSVGV